MSTVILEKKGDSKRLVGSNAGAATIGCGWDVADGQTEENAEFDLDVSLITRDAAGKEMETCYFNNLKLSDWVEHTGDNRTGEGEGDDEQIKVNLAAVPNGVAFVDVVVHVFNGKSLNQHFGMVEAAFARIVNDTTGEEVARINLTESEDAWGETGLWLARIDVQRAPTFINVSRFGWPSLTDFNNAVLPTIDA